MRKSYVIGLAVVQALTLASCTSRPIASPSTIAAVNVKAKQTIVATNNAYIAASKFGESLVALNVITKADYRAFNRRAYAARSEVVRIASIGTETDLTTATIRFGLVIAEIYEARR